MGAIVVRGNKDARLGQEEKNTPQPNWLRNAFSEAKQGISSGRGRSPPVD